MVTEKEINQALLESELYWREHLDEFVSITEESKKDFILKSGTRTFVYPGSLKLHFSKYYDGLSCALCNLRKSKLQSCSEMPCPLYTKSEKYMCCSEYSKANDNPIYENITAMVKRLQHECEKRGLKLLEENDG